MPTETVDIDSDGRYFGTVSALGLPEDAAWIEIQAESPVAAFELFATRNGWQLAGYSGTDLAKKQGILPLLENEGATGIAFVNANPNVCLVDVKALNDAGYVVSEKTVCLEPFEKHVSPAAELFVEGMSGATFIAYSADREVVMFQLDASSD